MGVSSMLSVFFGIKKLKSFLEAVDLCCKKQFSTLIEFDQIHAVEVFKTPKHESGYEKSPMYE